MGFLIPFTKTRIQTGNAESDVEIESYSQVYDSEVPNRKRDKIFYTIQMIYKAPKMHKLNDSRETVPQLSNK